MKMETLQIRLPPKQVDQLDKLVKEGEYASRSEAIRTMLRELDSIQETIEVMSDPELVKDIQQGLKDVREGRVTPLEEIWPEHTKSG